MVAQTRQAPTTTYRFSVAQFEQMIGAGVFGEEERVELIDGELIYMSPIYHPHAWIVANLEFIFHEMLGREAYVWTQQPLWLDEASRPQLDVALLKWRDDRYRFKRPTAEDVILLIEVSDTTLTYDRGKKRAKYAGAGITEYWIVHVKERVVEVNMNPRGNAYQDVRRTSESETLPLPGRLEGTIEVSELFGAAQEPQP